MNEEAIRFIIILFCAICAVIVSYDPPDKGNRWYARGHYLLLR